MTTMTVKAIHDQIEREAKTKAVQEKRVITLIKPKQHIRQGDVYLIAIEGVPATHKKVVSVNRYQLAPGETQGSRHIIEGADLKININENRGNDDMDGPVVVAEKGFTLTHPEHAHFDMPAGVYQVRYQLDYTTKERVRD